MSLAAGALSKVLVGQTTAQLSSAAATGGTGPYTYQWYRSTTNGFSAGAGNLIAGATSLQLSDSGLVGGTTYYYLVIATDTGNSNVTVTSSQLTVALQPALTQNQFAQAPVVGLVDMKVGPTNLIACQVDSSVTAAIYPGQAVKIVANTAGGTPKVAPCSAKDDDCIGFVAFNIKDLAYASQGNPTLFLSAGQTLEVAMWGSVIWCYATAAITQFAQVCIDPTYVGGVQPTGATATLVGQAFDGIGAAGAIRVILTPNPSFATA